MANTGCRIFEQAAQAVDSPPVPSQTEPVMTPSRTIHSLVLDAGPLIKNDPPVSSLLARAHQLYTLPSVLAEIRDVATRSHVETTLIPFLKLRSPKPESIKVITNFARRTGDLEVLSKPDIHLIALTYELECERNDGDWRLRKTPGQQGLNGKSPVRLGRGKADCSADQDRGRDGERARQVALASPAEASQNATANNSLERKIPEDETRPESEDQPEDREQPTIQQEAIVRTLDNLRLEPSALPVADTAPDDLETAETMPHEEEDEDDDYDDDGWITPSNLKKRQEKDQSAAPAQSIQSFLQVALLTSDYAIQNVLLRMNLNLVSPSLARITRVKTWVLRCHGCFQVTRDMTKRFCPKCGQPTLTRVSCSTDESGHFAVHLKKNFQWNNRGNVYSVPKPVHGSASGKTRGPGGGKGGWGRELIFAEDQKEYVKKIGAERKMKQRDLMDEDYLPSILSGDRSGGSGKIRIGAGRNVNSRRRH
ncbi:D-site 20S pre-rRNA nuclease [Xylariaceae sp. FL0662B]|nr:D-site 20S pre-rRNA nuclease [Xylariaceae sp. FL0662B]